MKVFRIQLPTVDNDGASTDTNSIVQAICTIAGGCTAIPGVGYWLDNGKLYQDAIIDVTTYCDASQCEQLIKRVDAWRVYLRQLALVYSVTDADVTFVE